jgi:formylglycine-generating enzyme required for sulfatase activity
MRFTKLAVVVASVAIGSLWTLVSVRVHAQTSQTVTKSALSASENPYDWKASFAKVPTGKVPRAPDGKPDLQGIWSFSILTPLERPSGEKRTEISAAEAEENEDVTQKSTIDLVVEPTGTPPGEKTTDAYNSFWRDGYWYKVPMTTLRTSQVVDPSDGRVPPITPEARERLRDATMRLNRPATGPEDRPTTSRCLRGTKDGPPIIGQGASSQTTTLQIVESPGVVVVREETLHDSQMIYLDGRPRPPDNIHLDKGASRGHWEGDTLVVDTTNFAPWATGVFSAYGNTDKMHLIERFKRLDDTHLLYGFTIDDPGTWTKPWSVEFVLWRLTDQEQLVEYACHEGNVGIEFTLSAARVREKENDEVAKLISSSDTPRAESPAPIHSPIEVSAFAHATNELGMEFVMVPPGEFQMGCSEGAKPLECTNDERPRHEVQITKGFEIQKTELTQKQWKSVMGTNPSAHSDDVDFPVERVSFQDVQEFLGKLNARNDGFLYRLPTEAEWEYAARAGTTDQYGGSLDDTAWYNKSSGDLIERIAANGGGASTQPVATKKPNAWGIYDMRGNVQEWVQDFYDPGYYSNSPVADPKGPATGDTHVVRGGSYHVRDWMTRVSLRANFPDVYEFKDVGFRVVREKR